MAEAPISTDPRYRARPTVRVGDRELANVTARVVTFAVTEREGGLSVLELRLNNFADDADYAFEDERDLRLGAQIAVYSGDELQPREIFRGVVSALEADFPDAGSSELVVLAEDPLQRSRMKRVTRVWENLALTDLVSAIAGELQLTPTTTELSATIGTHVQLNESNLAFLRRLLRRYDADVQVVGRELHVSPRASVRRGVVELALHGQLQAARFRVDLADQVTEVTTAGFDAAQGERVAASSSGTNLGPGSGRTGASLLRGALGERAEHVGHPFVSTADEATALADAAFDQRARRFVIVEGKAEGNPLIRVGTHVRIAGASARFNNTYYVVSACHRFDGTLYATHFEAECAYLGNA